MALVDSQSPNAIMVDQLLKWHGKNEALVFRRRVDFRKATQPDSKMDALRKKYKPINDPSALHKSKSTDKKKQQQKASEGFQNGNQLLDPSGFRRAGQVLFTKERLVTRWEKIRPIGSGLHNLGSTCFLNSVLQCLTYTPSLAEFFLARGHSLSCRIGDACITCKLENHVNHALSRNNGSSAFAPKGIVGRIKSIAKHMRIGNQEDAHEFLRYLVDAIQKSSLYGLDPKLDTRIQETTLIHQIFGGYLQSQILCSVCKHQSNTFDPCLDLSLDIQNGSTLEKALRRFTKPDFLVKSNRYRCEKCKKLVDATKQMTVYQLPAVLSIQLKRFSSWTGGKINKFVEFPKTLNMKSYISVNSLEDGPFDYNFYAVLVHAGGSARSGHYYSYIKSPSGTWYEMNDSMVSQVSERRVMQASAYLLFYQQSNISSHSTKVDPSTIANPPNPLSAKVAESPVDLKKRRRSAPPSLISANTIETPEEGSRPPSRQKVSPLSPKNKADVSNEIEDLFGHSHNSSDSKKKDKPVTQISVDLIIKQKTKRSKKSAEKPGNDNDGEWVVRDKNSTSSPGPASSLLVTSSNYKAMVVEWDESNDSKREKALSTNKKSTNNSPSVTSTPYIRNSQFKVPVNTWDNENHDGLADKKAARTKIIKSLNRKSMSMKRRPDAWDAEYDRGRTKKMRKNKKGSVHSNSN